MSAKLTPVFEVPADLSALPDPPVPVDLDLRHFDCMHLDVKRLLAADLWDECSGDEIATALRLWSVAWHQVPAGSLPNDDAKLIKLAGMIEHKKRWRGIRAGGLRGFKLCQDGRLYHIVICEMAMRAHSKSRAGRRGAQVKWGHDLNDKPLKGNKTGNATAYGTPHGRTDDTLYSNGDGKPHGSGDGRTDAEKGRIKPSPLPPSLDTPGSVDGPLGPTDRTTGQTQAAHQRSQEPEFVEVTMPTGAVIRISRSFQVDEVYSPRDCPDTLLTREQVKKLRADALAGIVSAQTMAVA